MPVFSMNMMYAEQIKGLITASVSPFTLPVQLAAGSADVGPGDAVKISSLAGQGAILVTKCAAADPAFGFVSFSEKKNTYAAGSMLEIGISGTIMILEAAAAITRGAAVEYVPTGAKVQTAGANPTQGRALDSAPGDGSLLRVLLVGQATFSESIDGGTINNSTIGAATPSTGAFTTLDASGAVTFTTGIVFEGATADAFETTFAITDPTADQTVTVPDATGTFSLLHQTNLVITPGATPSWTPGASHSLSTLTPGQDETIAAVTTGALKGKEYVIEVVTSGTSPWVLTFGANFKTTGTLSTGSVSAKTFIIAFVFDGTNFVEKSRTTAM